MIAQSHEGRIARALTGILVWRAAAPFLAALPAGLFLADAPSSPLVLGVGAASALWLAAEMAVRVHDRRAAARASVDSSDLTPQGERPCSVPHSFHPPRCAPRPVSPSLRKADRSRTSR